MKSLFQLFLVLVAASTHALPLKIDDLMWVHYSDVCPGQKLIPGTFRHITEEGVSKPDLEGDFLRGSRDAPKFRFTLHGVLNGEIQPHNATALANGAELRISEVARRGC